MKGIFTEQHTSLWQIHFYRSHYGDAGYKPIPVFEELIEDDIKSALIARFQPKKGFLPPLYADVLDEGGKIVMRLRRTFHDQAEVIPMSDAPPVKTVSDAV